MRAAQSSRFLYIFNPWSNGNRAMQSTTFHTNTYKRMVELAKNNEKLAKRMDLLKHRVVEEFYDIQSDPDCLVNLISDPSYKKEIEDLQSALEDEMRRTHDPALKIFVNRTDQQALEEYMYELNLTEHKRRNWIKTIKHEIKELLHDWIRTIKNCIKELLHLS